MHIALESPDQADIRSLIADLDRYQVALYPRESNHLLDIKVLMQSHVLFATARDAARVAQGCAAVVLHQDFGELKRMFVRPQARGQGIASALLSFLESQALGRGCPVLMLETGIRQPEAIALYRRFGYTERSAFSGYDIDPLSVFMQKTLCD